ncbi:MAG: hypothetical protein ACUVS2_09955 [Candidatus Flexifilum sp.]|jgi:hypothetical protein
MKFVFLVSALLGVLLSGIQPGIAQDSSEPNPIYFTTMTHMEGNFVDDRERAAFDQHIAQLTFLMETAERYGGIITVESERPFARAQAVYGINFMQTLVERGHGVGTHCDVGYGGPPLTYDQFVAALRENKALVDALVGPENNLNCSGAGGTNDYVRGLHEAGFLFMDGVVSMHYLSMPLENRPGPQWTDDYIRQGHFHERPFPYEEAVHPRLLADAQDFVPDPDGIMVVLSGEINAIDRLAEARAGQECRQRCPITTEDVEAAVAYLREIDSARDPNAVAQAVVHFPTWTLMQENAAVIQAFFQAMQQLAQEGVIRWAPLQDAYFAYIESQNQS